MVGNVAREFARQDSARICYRFAMTYKEWACRFPGQAPCPAPEASSGGLAGLARGRGRYGPGGGSQGEPLGGAGRAVPEASSAGQPQGGIALPGQG